VYGSRNALKKDFLELIDLIKEGGEDDIPIAPYILTA
jgi:hypothetical protein